MIARIATLVLGATTLYAFGGWHSASLRVAALQLKLDAYEAEEWHTADDRAAFAGRCAWHAGSGGMTVPPMVDDHLRKSFIAGWRQEEAREFAEAEMWNAGVKR